MTILVTGATGLVGARLLPRLVERGEECRALVRPGKSGPTGVTAVEGDLLDAASLADAVAGVSAIIHLAAVFRTQDTDLIWKSNLDGTRNLIAAAQAHAPEARFIMASTSNVYARNSTRPARESDPVEPEQAYPASKVAAEKLLRRPRSTGRSSGSRSFRRRRWPPGDVAKAPCSVRLPSRQPDEHDTPSRHRHRHEYGAERGVRPLHC